MSKNNRKEEPAQIHDAEFTESTSEALVPVANSITTPADFLDQFAEDAGAGVNDMGASDLAMPFLSILQKSSPQVDDTSKKYIEGAKAGNIFNTLTGELYDGKGTGIAVIPCGYLKQYTEWTPRDEGGGFLGHHAEGSSIVKNSTVDDKGKRWTAGHKTNLVDTAYYFLLVKTGDGAWTQAMLSMSSTQLKASRKWNSLMSGIVLKNREGKTFKPPMFSHVYLMKTVAQENDQGSWYGWDIVNAGIVSDADAYGVAREFHKQVASGEVRTGPPPSEESSAGAGGSGGLNDNVPF